MTQLSLKQLRYFVRIVQCGSISSASLDLNIAQTALGLQVRSLEASLGVTLLIRNAKGILPTAMGKLVYTAALGILASVDEIFTTVSTLSNSKPRNIWIGLPPNIVSAIGTSVVVLQDQYIPSVRLQISEGFRSNLIQDVINGKLDWAIIPEANEIKSCRSVPIFNQSIMLICKSGTALPPGPVALKHVLNGNLVLGSRGQVIPKLLSMAAQTLKLAYNVKFEAESINTQRQLILNENVWGLLPHACCDEDINQGTLEARHIIDPPMVVTGYLVTRSQDPLDSRDLPVLEFIDFLLDKHMAGNPCSGFKRLTRMATLLG